MPHLESLHEKHGAVIDFVAVNIGFSDPIEQVKKFRLEQALSVPVAYEPSHWLAKALGAPFMEGLGIPFVPYSVVIDRNGRIIHSGIGDKGIDAVISRLVARE
jgi:peroxiredoxin